jgi:hypothetical protein
MTFGPQALLHYFDKASGRKSKKPPQFAKKGKYLPIEWVLLPDVITGQKIVALVEATGLVCVERFKDYPQLGRFTLRDEGRPALYFLTAQILNASSVGKTIAIGKVNDLSVCFLLSGMNFNLGNEIARIIGSSGGVHWKPQHCCLRGHVCHEYAGVESALHLLAML